jgi:CubicO group peptidase (beta-lactamase class C family)
MRAHALCILPLVAGCATASPLPRPAALDAQVKIVMATTHANGLALAVIDEGKVTYVQAYGIRDAKGEPLRTDTVMYGASLTKAIMAYATLTLVDQGKISLDTPIVDDLDQPLASYGGEAHHLDKYGPYKDLLNDERWRRITPRMSLTHSTGFANFWFFEPDQKLRIHFDPGTQFSYSGEGFNLLQFVIEHGKKTQGLGIGMKMLTDTIFARLGMTRTSLQWRADLRPIWPTSGMTRGRQLNAMNDPMCVPPVPWIQPSATCRNSSPRWCEAMGCPRPLAPKW